MLKRNSLSLAVAAAVALVVSMAARAQELTDQELKPIVTVAFSGYGELIADLDVVGNLAGIPQLGATVEMSSMLVTGGRELKSLDKSKPWGVLAFSDGPEMQVLGFVPLTDLDELKAILESNAAEIEEADGKLTVSFRGQKAYVKAEGGWIFVSSQASRLDTLPNDPVAALGGLEKTHNLAVRLDVQNVPEMIRAMLVQGLQAGLESGMGQRFGESDEQFALRTKTAGQTFDDLKRSINELDSIQLGLAIDEKLPSIYLDIEVTALPDTETSRRLTSPKDMTTRFGGFVVSDAAVSYNGVSRLAANQVEQATAMIDGFRSNIHNELDGQGLPEDIEKPARQLVDDGFAVIASAVQEGEIDLGILLLTGKQRATWLGGIRVADGSKVEDLFKAVVEEAVKEMPELKDAVQFDAARHAGVRLHTFAIPTAEMGVAEVTELFGEELTIVVGATDKAAYLSVGSDALETLKKALDDSQAGDKKLPPATLAVSVGSLARLAAQYAPKPQTRAMAKMIADKLADANGKDRLTIVTTVLDKGQKVHIEIEEGLLKALGVLPAIFMGVVPVGGALLP